MITDRKLSILWVCEEILRNGDSEMYLGSAGALCTEKRHREEAPDSRCPSGVRPLLSAEGSERLRSDVPVRSRENVAAPPPERDADEALAEFYRAHYRSLTRLATLLAGDGAAAEEIVRDAFVAMHGAWRRLRGGDRALRYLQETVVRRSRSRPAARPAGQRPDLVAALRALPAPQREALVLRYYADMPESLIASLMGTSIRAVSGHIACGMSALEAALGPR
jgi:DNA-directed RNA polymerase specialized sigma24 family protein